MHYRTEQEIMQNWENNIDSPVVSICCATFNHELYISEAIDGFLMQETDFPFEILIRDDCSTDKTASIIKEYADKYPSLIKPAFEKENTYSKGVKPMPQLYKISKGKYIALCDGDDYWTDKNKLQIQINEMRKYQNCDISFHPAQILYKSQIREVISKHSTQNKVFTTAEIISGYGDFCPTASLIIKKEVVENLPKWFYDEAPIGDYFLQIFGSIRGGALYINHNMSIYRQGETGSWSQSQNDFNNKMHFINKITVSLNLLDMDLRYKYNNEIKYILNKVYWEFLTTRIYSILDKKEFYDHNKNELLKKQKILWFLFFSRPLVQQYIMNIKNMLREVKYGISTILAKGNVER